MKLKSLRLGNKPLHDRFTQAKHYARRGYDTGKSVMHESEGAGKTMDQFLEIKHKSPTSKEKIKNL